jgi:hypothetical protein
MCKGPDMLRILRGLVLGVEGVMAPVKVLYCVYDRIRTDIHQYEVIKR